MCCFVDILRMKSMNTLCPYTSKKREKGKGKNTIKNPMIFCRWLVSQQRLVGRWTPFAHIQAKKRERKREKYNKEPQTRPRFRNWWFFVPSNEKSVGSGLFQAPGPFLLSNNGPVQRVKKIRFLKIKNRNRTGFEPVLIRFWFRFMRPCSGSNSSEVRIGIAIRSRWDDIIGEDLCMGSNFQLFPTTVIKEKGWRL